jgi:hypothetical protein
MKLLGSFDAGVFHSMSWILNTTPLNMFCGMYLFVRSFTRLKMSWSSMNLLSKIFSFFPSISRVMFGPQT